jgi:uncharacterized protein (TIGR02453 family)
MTDPTTFAGFPPEGRQFLRDLADNNNRDWFEANKTVYEQKLLGPAVDFVVALGTRLQALDPAIVFDTRTNGQGTLIRIYRDVRFSADKSPYKTAVAGMFGDGAGKKMERPGFGFHLQADVLELMAGIFQFTKPQLETYRAAVVDDRSGRELEAALAAVRAAGDYRLEGEGYKRVPQGYDPDHPRAALLKMTGLHVQPAGGIRTGLSEPWLVEVAYGHFEAMAPVYDWLKGILD